jgi:hypothetical protein
MGLLGKLFKNFFKNLKKKIIKKLKFKNVDACITPILEIEELRNNEYAI